MILVDYETELQLQQLFKFIPDAIRTWNSLQQQLIQFSNVELLREGIHEKFTQLYQAKLALFNYWLQSK